MGSNVAHTQQRSATPIVDDLGGWRSCLGRFYCFLSRKQSKRHRPGRPLPSGPLLSHNHQEHNSLPLDLLNQVALLPPVMCAPPSSPITIMQLDSESSSQQSPVTMLSPSPRKAGNCCLEMGAVSDGIFPFNPILVTPPVVSTLTTEPPSPISTAPFTPPPELAHLTRPSSPEVPLGELVSSSLKIKCSTISDHIGEHFTWRLMPSSNLDLVYQVYPCNEVGTIISPSRSEASSSGTVSPLPERVRFLDSDVDDAAASMQENSLFHGFDNATFLWNLHQSSAGKIKDEYCVPIDLCIDGKNPIMENYNECHIEAQCSCEVTKEQLGHCQAGEKSEGMCKGCMDCDLVYSDKGQVDGVLEDPKYCTEMVKLPFQGLKDLLNDQVDFATIEISDKGKEEDVSGACQSELAFSQNSPNVCIDAEKCCSTCGELTSKCKFLSEALQQTKEKLSLIEKRVNSIDEREQKWKQLIHWMQLGAKLQQENVLRLSEELSWHGDNFLELQQCHLAELGIELSEGPAGT